MPTTTLDIADAESAVQILSEIEVEFCNQCPSLKRSFCGRRSKKKIRPQTWRCDKVIRALRKAIRKGNDKVISMLIEWLAEHQKSSNSAA